MQPDAEVVLATELRAQQAKDAEIKGVGKPSFFEKATKKIKKVVKEFMGK